MSAPPVPLPPSTAPAAIQTAAAAAANTVASSDPRGPGAVGVDPDKKPAPVNRFTQNPLDYGAGVSFDQILKYNTKGEYDFNRKIMIKVLEQFWTTNQTYHFAFFAISVVLIIVAGISWIPTNTQFNVNYFVLGTGASVLQSFFKHGLAKCDKKTSQMRAEQVCFSYLDCTNTTQVTREQQKSCKVPMSTVYQATRIVQFILLVVGIVMVVKEPIPAFMDGMHSFFLGFGIFYILSYSMT